MRQKINVFVEKWSVFVYMIEKETLVKYDITYAKQNDFLLT